MEVQTVSRKRRKVRAEVLVRDIRVVFGMHRLRLVGGDCAVATTERQIVRAIDDGHRFAVLGLAAEACQAVELAVSDGAFGSFSFLENRGIEAGFFEEADLVGDDDAGNEEGVVQEAEAQGLVFAGNGEVQGLQEQGLA